jgi:N-acetylmuramoyl-L-alanine amidase
MRFLQLFWIAFACGVVFLSGVNAGQIDLVYPPRSQDGSPYVFADTVSAASLFGNISPASASLEINGRTVEVSPSGAFLAFVPLDTFAGTKSFRIAQIEQGKESALLQFPYIFAREKQRTPEMESGEAVPYTFPLLLQVTAPSAVTRTIPDGTYELFPLPGTKMVAAGIKEQSFVIYLGAGSVTYIDSQFVRVDSTGILEPAVLGDITVASGFEQSSLRIPISSPRLFRTWLSDDLRELTVSFYQAASDINKITFDPWSGGVDLVRWRPGVANQVDICVHCTRPIQQGYSVAYSPEGTTVEVTIRHEPKGHARSLRGKCIVVDPGHGGDATGAVGPLRTVEKDVVLQLAKLLAKELTSRGAVVFLTRDRDTTLSLHDRVDFARAHQADFLISLHANALPDGENPFLRHGSGTYYYSPGCRPAAEAVHRRLLRATKLRDDGIFYDDLALVRPTEFPAVLVEVAYMMYPDEEMLLRDEKFLERVAKGLSAGIRDYFRTR